MKWTLFTRDTSFPAEPPSPVVTAVGKSFDVRSLELVREFVEHLFDAHATRQSDDTLARHVVDWEMVEACISDCHSIEHAIGRAVLAADQMARGVFDGGRLRALRPAQGQAQEAAPALDVRGPQHPPHAPSEDAFFAFSVADAVADFGDESRYRTKVAKKVARVLRAQRTSVAPAVAP